MSEENEIQANEVSVDQDKDEWRVVVRVEGKEEIYTFSAKEWAMNFAEGQRLCLGLATIEDRSKKHSSVARNAGAR